MQISCNIESPSGIFGKFSFFTKGCKLCMKIAQMKKIEAKNHGSGCSYGIMWVCHICSRWLACCNTMGSNTYEIICFCWAVFVSLCQSVYLSVSLFICLSVSQIVGLSVGFCKLFCPLLCIWHRHSCLPVGTLHTLPTLQNNKPVPQVLKQVVNLSC